MLTLVLFAPDYTSEDEVVQQALAAPGVQKYLIDRQIVKTIYAAGRLINVVVK